MSRAFRAVLLTQEPGVRDALTRFAAESGGNLTLALDLNLPLADLTSSHFRSIQQAAPCLVFVDFDGYPDLGLTLTRDLAKASEQLLVVGIGDAVSSDLLLRAIRAGLAEYLVKPLSPESIREALERLAPRLAQDDDEPEELARTLAFFSAKGGSGTSTAVLNIGIELHRLTGKRTLVVDLDAELGEISLLLGVQPQFNFVDLVQNFHRMDASLLSSYIEQHTSGVHLLSAPFHPERAAEIRGDQIRQVLLYLRQQYDYVLVDTPKSFSAESLATFEQADGLFLIATIDLPSLRNIQRVLPLLRRVMPHGLEQVHLVINRYDPDSEVKLKDVERTLGLPVFATLSNDYETLIRSVNTGKPVVLGAPKSAYAKDVQEVARKIAQVADNHDAPQEGEGNLLTRLWRKPKEADQRGGQQRG